MFTSLLAQTQADIVGGAKAATQLLDYGAPGLLVLMTCAVVYLFVRVINIMQETNKVIVGVTTVLEKQSGSLETIEKNLDKTMDKVDDIYTTLLQRPCTTK